MEDYKQAPYLKNFKPEKNTKEPDLFEGSSKVWGEFPDAGLDEFFRNLQDKEKSPTDK